MFKKVVALCLFLALSVSFVACNEGSNGNETSSLSEKTEDPEYNQSEVSSKEKAATLEDDDSSETEIASNTSSVSKDTSSTAYTLHTSNMDIERENYLRQNYIDNISKGYGVEYEPEDINIIYCFYDSEFYTILLIEPKGAVYDEVPVTVTTKKYIFKFKAKEDVPMVYSGGVFFEFETAIENDILPDDVLKEFYNNYARGSEYIPSYR